MPSSRTEDSQEPPRTAADGLARQHALGYMAQIFAFALPVAQNLLFPLLLGPEQFGTLTIANGVAYLPMVLTEPGFAATMIWYAARWDPPDAGAGGGAGRTMSLLGALRLGLALIVAASVSVAAPLIAALYGLPGKVSLIRLAGVLFVCIGVYTTLDSFLISVRRNDLSALGRLAANVLCVGTPLLLWSALRTPAAMVGGTAAGYAAAALATLALAWRAGLLRGGTGGVQPATPKPNELLRSVAVFAVIYFALGMQSWGLVSLAGIFVAPRNVGYLKIAVGAVQATISLAPMPALVIFTYLVSLGNQPERFQRYFSRVARLVALLSPGLVAMAALLARRTVALVYGPAYGPVAPLLVCVVCSQTALILVPLAFQALAVVGQRQSVVRAFAVLLLVELASGLVLLRLFHEIGAAATLAVFPWIFLLWSTRRLARCGLAFPWSSFGPGLVGVVALVAVSGTCLLLLPGLVGLAAALVSGATVYGAAVWLVGRQAHDDLRRAWRDLLASPVPANPPLD